MIIQSYQILLVNTSLLSISNSVYIELY